MTEDVILGLRYGGKLGYGIPIGDSIELWDVSAYVTHFSSLGNQQRLELSGYVNSEVVRNTFVKLTGKYYKKFSWHTVATHLTTKLGPVGTAGDDFIQASQGRAA